MITHLAKRGDNTDFTVGNIPAGIQEDAQESNSCKCSNFNETTEGDIHSEESDHTEDGGFVPSHMEKGFCRFVERVIVILIYTIYGRPRM